MKTRATSFLLATLAVVSLVLPALAADTDAMPEETTPKGEEVQEVRSAVLLDGEVAEAVEFDIMDGVCYVTVSSFATLMDAEAMVEEEDGTVSVSASTVVDVVADPSGEAEANVVTADLDLTACAGGAYVAANGRYLYAKDGLIQINGRVAAPVRVMARVYELDVDYDAEHALVLLSRREGAQPYLAEGSSYYPEDVLLWLSRIIHAESGNQPLAGKIAVGNVVMNRVNDPKFPNNVYDVLFQKNQFSPAASGSIYREPNAESVVAAKLVLDGAEVAPTALFFNGAGATRSYAARHRTYVTTIGDHAFYE